MNGWTEKFLIHASPYLPEIAAVTVVLVLLSVVWPVLADRSVEFRARALATDIERMRRKEREQINQKAKTSPLKSLREQLGKGLFSKLFDQSFFKKAVSSFSEQEALRLQLSRAGIRHPFATYYFIAARIGGFIAFGVGGFLYLNLIGLFSNNQILAYAVVGAVALGGFFLPNLLLKNQIKKRLVQINRFWPDAIDLLIICVEGGLTIEAAMRRVAVELAADAPFLAEEFTLTTAELAYIQDRRRAFLRLSDRVDLPAVKSVTLSLIQSERHGTPVGRSLRIMARENRDERIAIAERKSAALGPKLTVPMIVFFLPVLFAVIIAPVFLRSNL